MDNHPSWLLDESTQVGVDNSDINLVKDYDKHHEGFRDYQQEAQKIANDLGLSPDSVVLDIGCGTGGLSMHLANICKHVFAVDISPAMIEVLKGKIADLDLKNITTECAGFLRVRWSTAGFAMIFG